MEEDRCNTDDSIDHFVREMHSCIDDDNLAHTRQLVSTLSRDDLAKATRQKSNENATLLSHAAWRRRTAFVSFLLDGCFADVDQRAGHSGSTPLCLCCEDPDLDIEVVRLLIEHGADVNAVLNDRRRRSAVHSACDVNNVSVVEYLVECGRADINRPDDQGETCLMASIQNNKRNYPLVYYLLDNGASVNNVDNFGDTALHHAASGYGDKCIIRQLLDHGADASIYNLAGDDVLRAAALHGGEEILEYLIEELQPSQPRRADLYALVAAQAIDQATPLDRDCVTTAVEFWEKALSARAQYEPITGVPYTHHPVYGDVEAHDLESLEAVASNDEALRVQAFICRERILGAGHPETIRRLSERAVCYATRLDAYERAVELYSYAAESCSLSPVHALWVMDPHVELLQLFWTRHQQEEGSVSFEDVTDMMQMLLTDMANYLPNIFPHECIRDMFLQLSVDVLHLLHCLVSSRAERLALKRYARELVQSTYKTNFGTVLHYAVDPDLSLVSGGSGRTLVVEELLHAGIDVNVMNSAGNTPLHVAVMKVQMASGKRPGLLVVIDVLVRHGAQLDIPNLRGQTAVELLPPVVEQMLQ